MSTFIILAALVALLIWVLMQLSKKQRPAPEPLGPGPARPDLANLKITDARAGDVISISGAGDNFSDLDFTADRYTRYEAGAHPWFELSGSYRERRVSLRVAGDEELEVAVHNDARRLSLEDIGLNEEDLAQMDERQNTADSFEFDGKVWLYRRSREARAFRNGQPVQPAAFYYWEFQEQNGKALIAIRKLEGEPFAVTLYTGVPEGDITVYRGR
ncbi:MAG: hypothetical protein JO336_15250 [Acidobacteriia bacterium]|nr:hypothetical protein [Terriglobia bacterium]